MRPCCHVTVQNVDYMLSNLGDEFSERFQMAVDPQPPHLRMVSISGNLVHAFHAI